jgi:hypothetical protein
VKRTLHPSAGVPLRRRDVVDDVLRAQAAALEAIAQDANLPGAIGNVRPLRAVYDYEQEDDE